MIKTKKSEKKELNYIKHNIYKFCTTMPHFRCEISVIYTAYSSVSFVLGNKGKLI